MSRYRDWIVTVILVGAVGACGPLFGNGKLNLSNPHASPAQFACPAGSTNAAYEETGTVDVDNQTGGNVTFKSASTSAQIVAVHGNFGGSVGDKSGAADISFSPKSVASGSKVTVKFTTPWHCSNPGASDPNIWADFAVKLTLATSSGTYSIDLPHHRLKMG